MAILTCQMEKNNLIMKYEHRKNHLRMWMVLALAIIISLAFINL